MVERQRVFFGAVAFLTVLWWENNLASQKHGHGHRRGNLDTNIGEMGQVSIYDFEIRNMGYGVDFDKMEFLVNI